MRYDLLIRGGQVVLPHAVVQADVGVVGERVAAIAAPGALGTEAARLLDADGLYVLPGAVDPHTHLNMRATGGTPTVDFGTSSAAAAYGGTTTFVDFAAPTEGETLLDAVARRRAEADPLVAIDYSLHAVLARPDRALIGQIPEVVAAGIPSFKAFTIESVLAEPLDDGFLLGAMQAVAAAGGLLGLHAESAALVDYCVQALLAEGKTDVAYFSTARPPVTEYHAVQRALALAAEASAALYFFHLSAARSVAELAAARRAGQPVYAETCPHYLAFSDAVYREPWERAIQFVRFPPLKGEADRVALWQAAGDGTLSAIGSDDVSVQFAAKQELSRGRPFNRLPGGMPQIETRVSWLFSEGVSRGRLSLQRFVDLVAAGPAHVFGLYPRKGAIAIGSDADLVLYDPRARWTVTWRDLHQGCDYTVYEGWELVGRPTTTIARGKVIVEHGRYVGRHGDGRFLPRAIAPTVLRTPAC